MRTRGHERLIVTGSPHREAATTLLGAVGEGSWSGDDEPSVPRLAHRLEGGSAALGAARLAEPCRQLQTASAPTPDLDRALLELDEESRRVRAAVTDLLSRGE